MTRTPISRGKCDSRTALMVLAISPNITSPFSSKWPVKPPPTSSRSIEKPRSAPASKMERALSMAVVKVARFLQADPTWKDTPTTLRPKRLAVSSSMGASCTSAPYFRPSGTRASGSSARMRRTNLNAGFNSEIFSSSETVSKVVSLTLCSLANLMSEARLQGWAKIMRSGGTPIFSIISSSPFDAQSKPVPSAIINRRRPGSG
mmetsp:Transcript_7867/g.15331  ORF Transcript_7867/g.15331 Transcript_7867/m.15331 type:complete len:204 (+) Transcript_7867:1160-1771(+)